MRPEQLVEIHLKRRPKRRVPLPTGCVEAWHMYFIKDHSKRPVSLGYFFPESFAIDELKRIGPQQGVAVYLDRKACMVIDGRNHIISLTPTKVNMAEEKQHEAGTGSREEVKTADQV